MKLRKIKSGLLAFFGSVLIVLSFRANTFWNEGSTQFSNLSEAGLIYGLLLVSMGFVLMFLKEVSSMQFLWMIWVGLFAIQMVRIHPAIVLVSHFMNSTRVFWGTIGLGILLAVATIWQKCRSIF